MRYTVYHYRLLNPKLTVYAWRWAKKQEEGGGRKKTKEGLKKEGKAD